MRRYGLPVLFSLMIAAAATAQPAPPPGPGGPRPGEPGGREGLRETVEIYMVHQMKGALELTDEQSLRVLDLHKEHREAMRSVHEGRRELMGSTRTLLGDEGATDGEFRRALREEEELRKQEMAIQEEFREGLEKILSPRQQVQFLIFEPRFREGIRRRIEGIQRMGGGEERRERMEQRQKRLEQLRKTDPEKYEELQRRRMERTMEEIREKDQ